MAGHRTQIKIVGEILDTATQEIDEYEGTTITHIMIIITCVLALLIILNINMIAPPTNI